jgi:hypothetical protein
LGIPKLDVLSVTTRIEGKLPPMYPLKTLHLVFGVLQVDP